MRFAGIERRLADVALIFCPTKNFLQKLTQFNFLAMEPRKSPFDLSRCARPNILALEPYRCAREYVCHPLDPQEF